MLTPEKKKTVNITLRSPISSVNPPIRSNVRNVRKTVRDIRLIILGRATVEEVMSDGSTVLLTLQNYNQELNTDKTESIKVEESVKVLNPNAGIADELTVENMEEIMVEEVIAEVEESVEEKIEEETTVCDEEEVLEESEVVELEVEQPRNNNNNNRKRNKNRNNNYRPENKTESK